VCTPIARDPGVAGRTLTLKAYPRRGRRPSGRVGSGGEGLLGGRSPLGSTGSTFDPDVPA
jgi:hypothetical protein